MTGPVPGLAAADQILLQLFGVEAAWESPYSLFDALRERAPVHRSELGPVWVLTRHLDCLTVLRDPRLGKGDRSASDLLAGSGLAARPIPRAMRRGSLVFMDPPDHTRVRALVSRAFTPRRVDALSRAVQTKADELLDDLAEQGRGDVVAGFGFTLPAWVVGELVGVPEDDRATLRELVRDASLALEPGATNDAITAAEVAAGSLARYFDELVRRRRSSPGTDLLSDLIAVRDLGGDRLSRRELLGTVSLLFSAGFETTTNLIASLVLLAAADGDASHRLRSDGRVDAVASAVEEVLRFESPVQLAGGEVRERLEIDGHRLSAGDYVVALLGAANRDPEVFARPSRFDVLRHPNPHLAFSAGAHHCLGAALARLEGRIVLERLLTRFSSIRISRSPTWRRVIAFRGLKSLEIEVVAT